MGIQTSSQEIWYSFEIVNKQYTCNSYANCVFIYAYDFLRNQVYLFRYPFEYFCSRGMIVLRDLYRERDKREIVLIFIIKIY